MQELRQEPRCHVEEEVLFTAPGQEPAAVDVMDLSVRGLRVRLHYEARPGTVVRVGFTFLSERLSGQSTEAEAEVMHRFPEPGGVTWQTGLRLLSPRPDLASALASFLAACD